MPVERKLAAIMFTDIAGYTAFSTTDKTKAIVEAWEKVKQVPSTIEVLYLRHRIRQRGWENYKIQKIQP